VAQVRDELTSPLQGRERSAPRCQSAILMKKYASFVERHARKANLYGLPIHDQIGAPIQFAMCYVQAMPQSRLPVIEANRHGNRL
jgi:hypothetical protein